MPCYCTLCAACFLEQYLAARIIQRSDVMQQYCRPKTKLGRPMNSDTNSFRRIVKARARELKHEGRGYLEAVNQVVDELLDGARGKHTRIFATGLMSPVEILAIVKVIATLLGVAANAWKAWVTGREKQQVERERLEQKVAPLVSEVFEETDAHASAT